MSKIKFLFNAVLIIIGLGGSLIGGGLPADVDADNSAPNNYYFQEQKVLEDQAGETVVSFVQNATPEPDVTPQATPPSRSEIDKGFIPEFQKETATNRNALSNAIRSPLFVKGVSEWLGKLEVKQGGIIWISVIVVLLVAFDYSKLISWRNFDLLLLLVPSFLFIDIIRFSTGLDDPSKLTLSGYVFMGVLILSAMLLIRALVRIFRSPAEKPWVPNVPFSALVLLLIILFVSNTFLALARFPDDAGSYTNKGTGRMLETGYFPYADPILKGGSAATYGPVMYVAHIPFQLGLREFNDLDVQADVDPVTLWIAKGQYPQYDGPPILASKLTVIFFHMIGVLALLAIGWQLASPAVGLGLACLYTGSAYVQGVGGDTHFITGMTFISHIAPAAMTLLAFAFIRYPVASGALLAVSTGTLFYPAFFFPLWFGYYFWKGKGWVKFAASFVVVCAVIGITVVMFTQSTPEESAIRAIYESTVGHQEARNTYGASTFSFWGTHPQLAAFWQEPFIEGLYLVRPSFLLFAVFIVGTFFFVRGRTVPQLALLTAAVAISIQLWKSHAGGTYVEWYYPFFLIGMLTYSKFDSNTQQPLHAEKAESTV